MIATAGHVDHGKSTLVQRLTGIDPDRLEEEKARGMTIDLGFAWLTLPSGVEVGIVDVPGHERFIKNMLAGVGAVGATLFVVAANEGWKPQSQEHLDILSMLGVADAVVAMTKVDAVGPDQLEQIRRDIAGHLKETTLEGSPIVGVSALTGDGIEELLATLDRSVARADPVLDLGRPRLWIDRSFTIKGSGTVVTGTLIEGGLQVGQELQLLPGGHTARVRAIQSHRRQLERIGPGHRTAVNLTGIEHRSLARGDIATLPGTHLLTDTFIGAIRYLPRDGIEPSEKGAFKVHVGSLELDASLKLLGTHGDQVLAIFKTDLPAPLVFGDRFVLREAGRRQTQGGGRVIEVAPGDRPRADLAAMAGRRAAATSGRDYLAVVMAESGWMRSDDAWKRSGVEVDTTEKVIFDDAWLASALAKMVSIVESFHVDRPLEPGKPKAELRAELGWEQSVFDAIVERSARDGLLVVDGAHLRIPSFSPQIGSAEQRALIDLLESRAPSVPPLEELTASFPMPLIRALERSGNLVRVSDDLFYTAGYIRELEATVRSLCDAVGPFTVAQFRDQLATTRRYAVPLLEFLDRAGSTRRRGDVRECAGA